MHRAGGHRAARPTPAHGRGRGGPPRGAGTPPADHREPQGPRRLTGPSRRTALPARAHRDPRRDPRPDPAAQAEPCAFPPRAPDVTPPAPDSPWAPQRHAPGRRTRARLANAPREAPTPRPFRRTRPCREDTPPSGGHAPDPGPSFCPLASLTGLPFRSSSRPPLARTREDDFKASFCDVLGAAAPPPGVELPGSRCGQGHVASPSRSGPVCGESGLGPQKRAGRRRLPWGQAVVKEVRPPGPSRQRGACATSSPPQGLLGQPSIPGQSCLASSKTMTPRDSLGLCSIHMGPRCVQHFTDLEQQDVGAEPAPRSNGQTANQACARTLLQPHSECPGSKNQGSADPSKRRSDPWAGERGRQRTPV